MPSVLLWACLAENLFLFAAQKNLRIFLSCFFTGRGRDGKQHLLLSACGRRAATSDWRSLKKRLRDLHAEQAGISSFLGWSLLLWDYQPPPTRIRSAQETMRKKASRPLDGSPFVFFGVTLSAQSDFLDLGGSELEGPDSLPLLILHLCDCNRSVGVVTVVLCAADLVLGSEFDLDGVAGGSSCGAAGCCGSSAGGSGRAAGGGQLSCNSRTGQIKNALAQCAKTAPMVDIPTGWNPNTKKEPTGLFFAACGRPCSFDSSYGLHETATTLDIPSRWDPRTKQQPTGLIAYPAAQGRAVRFPYGSN